MRRQTLSNVVVNVLSQGQVAPTSLADIQIEAQTGSTVWLAIPDDDQAVWFDYQWRQVAGESVVLSDTDMPRSSFVIPAAAGQQGPYQFELIVRNAAGHASIANVNVNVSVIENQLFDAAYQEIEMDSPGNPVVGIPYDMQGERYLVAAETVTTESIDTLSQNPAMPVLVNGLFQFDVRMFEPGAVTQRIQLAEPALADQWFWAYNPLTEEWLTTPSISWSFNEDRTEVAIEVVDNGVADGNADRHAISIVGGLGAALEPEAFAAQSEQGHCFIATALYVDDHQGKLQLLRDFRDEILLSSALGEAFVRSYYRQSPPVANWLRDNTWAQTPARIMLLPAVGIAWLIMELSWLVVLFSMLALMLFIYYMIRARCSRSMYSV